MSLCDSRLIASLLPCLLLSYCTSLAGAISNGIQTKIQCLDTEREALLTFKQGILADHCGLLSSWTNQEDSRDCCRWHGIRCNNLTGHVNMLDLHGGRARPSDPSDLCLEGKISPTLQELKHLTYLDLSMNSFQYQPIPNFIGSFTSLRYLNLSNAGFKGEVPHHLGNLSKLASLDLSGRPDDKSCFPCLYANSLQWLSRITLLRDVNLNEIDLSQATDWMQIVNNLPFLKELRMHQCRLSPKLLPSLSYTNCSTTLQVLTLSSNLFSEASIYQWLFNLSRISTHLAHVDLQYNYLPGAIPNDFGNMHSLAYLDLSLNLIQDKIPRSFGNMSSLSYLSLSYNQLEGPIPDTFSNLEHLAYLDLTGNFFEGSGWVPKALGNLCSLQTLSLSNNNLSGDVSSIIETLSRCACQSLVHLDLSQSGVWGSIPDSISKFSSLRELHIEYNELNGTISPGLGQLSMLQGLYLNSNSLRGNLSDHHLSNLSRLRYLYLNDNPELAVSIRPNWIPPFQLYEIHLSSCRLGPLFPNWLVTQTSFSELDISNARISDIFPPFWGSLPLNIRLFNMSQNHIYGVLPHMSITFQIFPSIDLSSNSFTGAIPSFLRNASSVDLSDNKFSDLAPFFCPKTNMVLSQLDLSNNLFSGELPDCWMYFERLSVLHLENNKFQGTIPASIGVLKSLKVLHMGNNSLSGELPASLENCTSMIILDFAYNSLTGYITPKIGNSFKSLALLKLRKNNFSGGIPLSLCQLSDLQILDLSANHFSGTIPNCIYNFTAMINKTDYLKNIAYQIDTNGSVQYDDVAWLMWKRKERSFMSSPSSLGLVKSIDFSDNEFQGQIPDGIASLVSLVSLDLSGNNLNGSITPKIGQLTSLDYLDLSDNHLSGEIPASLAYLNSLGTLNLSDNNLSGRIPTGPQLQTFDASSYKENPNLCGAPLRKCHEDKALATTPNGDNVNQQENSTHSHDDFFLGLCISVVLGFITGFWGFLGTLVLKRSWGHAYFQFIEDKLDSLHVMFTVNIARAWRKP